MNRAILAVVLALGMTSGAWAGREAGGRMEGRGDGNRGAARDVSREAPQRDSGEAARDAAARDAAARDAAAREAAEKEAAAREATRMTEQQRDAKLGRDERQVFHNPNVGRDNEGPQRSSSPATPRMSVPPSEVEKLIENSKPQPRMTPSPRLQKKARDKEWSEQKAAEDKEAADRAKARKKAEREPLNLIIGNVSVEKGPSLIDFFGDLISPEEAR